MRTRSLASSPAISTVSRPGSRPMAAVSAIDGAAMAALVDPSAPLELVADGFGFTEGPVWHEDGSLFFSDVPNDTIVRWDRVTGARSWRRPAGVGRSHATLSFPNPPPGRQPPHRRDRHAPRALDCQGVFMLARDAAE